MIVVVALSIAAYLALSTLVAVRKIPEEDPHGWADYAAVGAWGLVWPICVAVMAVVTLPFAAMGWAVSRIRRLRTPPR